MKHTHHIQNLTNSISPPPKSAQSSEQDRIAFLEQAGLLQIAKATFSEILSCNLTRGTYHILQYDAATTLGTPQEGLLEQMLLPRLANIAPQHQEAFKNAFFPEGQLAAIASGQEKVQLSYQRRGADGLWHWMETILVPQENPFDDDLLTFAVSHNIDGEKEKEHQLLEQLRQQSEELALTMSQADKHISYYDILTQTLTTSPTVAQKFHISPVIENYPQCFLDNPPPGYTPDIIEKLPPFIEAIRRGDPSGFYEYSLTAPDGQKFWFRRAFTTIFDDQKRPVRAVISSENVTQQYEQLQQQEMSRIGLLHITQLVFPEIFACNLTRNTCTVLQSLQEISHELPLDTFLAEYLSNVAPEDQNSFRNQFFRENQLNAIAAGKERFQLTYRRRDPDGQWHWIETISLYYSNPYNNNILVYTVSRNVDQQKAQEELLRQALADSTEKLDGWLYYNSLSSQSFPGLVYVNYDDNRPSPYSVGTLAKRLDCPPRELALSTCFRIPPADKGSLLLALEKAKLFGETSFQAEYRVETDRGETVWIHNHAIRFQDKTGCTGYIHFLTDTTHEHTLMEQLRIHMEARLKTTEQIFNIVAQHSNRSLYQYDLATGITKPLEENLHAEDILSHLYNGSYSPDSVQKNCGVLPESVSDVKKFFSDIHSGIPSGELHIHVQLQDGHIRWYHFHYSTIFDGNTPITALISVEDITLRHQQELAYLRHQQAVELNMDSYLIYLEACLICDRVETLAGQIHSILDIDRKYSYSGFKQLLIDRLFTFDDGNSLQYFSRENLTNLYALGERNLNRDWKVYFRDGTTHWLNVNLTLTADPFNNHIKVSIRVSDITQAQEEQLSLVRRAEYDSMTGLLRRDVGEARIQSYLSRLTIPGGVLLVLDLDDLKGINDNLGHQYGDEAIVAISNALKAHFRKEDIMVRVGGDEFMVFIPGAGQSIGAVELSLAALLKKLSLLSIGDDQHRRYIHCSIGCAVELPETDTFDSLYQRADIALYHVKRSGKNNFIFFEPDMLEASYHLKTLQAPPVLQELSCDSDLHYLLSVISQQYPGIVHFNLTQDRFRIIAVGSQVKDVHAPDKIHVFWDNWRHNIHPEDQEITASAMSRDTLLSLYTRGKRNIRRYFRNLEATGYVNTQVNIQFYATNEGDICTFLFFRWETPADQDPISS